MSATNRSPLDRSALLILLSAATVIAWIYILGIDVGQLYPRMKVHLDILNRTAASPYQYRILAPFLAEGITRLLAPIAGYDTGFMVAYAVIDFLSFAWFYPLIYRFLRTWFSAEQALIGALVAAILTFDSLRDHTYAPWSWVENTLVVLALILMVERKRVWLAVVIVIAALNRETAVFLPVAYGLTAIPLRDLFSRKRFPSEPVRWTALYFVLWLVVTVAIRIAQGPAPDLFSMADYWAYNARPFQITLTLADFAMFLGVFWVYFARGYRSAPDFVKRASGIIPLYLVGILVLSHWQETRPLIPAYPLFIAAALSYLFPEARRNWPEANAAPVQPQTGDAASTA